MYVSEECLVNFKTISGDEPLIIWVKLDSSDTPQILLEQDIFGNLWYFMVEYFVVWTAPVVHHPELSLPLVSYLLF